jgi:hypothetical protein
MITRRCTDRTGTAWEVFEVFPAAERRVVERVPESFRGGWLCFQSFTERRRLAPIPLGWEKWDDPTLLSASEQGQRSQRRTPPELRVQVLPDELPPPG